MKFFSNVGGAQSSGVPAPATAPLTVKTADVPVRLAFLRKVYTLLTLNLAITIAVSVVFASVDPIKDYIVRNQWVLYLSIGVAFAAFLVLACMKNISFPLNLILMYVFVAAFSVLIGSIVANYFDRGWGGIVIKAFIATATVFLVITAYVFITKKDFSFLYGALSAGVIVLVVLIVINYAISWATGRFSRTRSFLISLAGCVSLSLILTMSPCFQFHLSCHY